jgi:hypothetical protein
MLNKLHTMMLQLPSTICTFLHLNIAIKASQSLTLTTMQMEKIIKCCNNAINMASSWKHCKGVAIITVLETF